MSHEKVDPDDPFYAYAGHVDPRLKPIPDAKLRQLVNDFRRAWDAADSDLDARKVAYAFRDAIGEAE